MKTRTLAKFAKREEEEEEKKEKYISKYKHTHTHTHEDLRDENGREREVRETGITVIRTVSSAYVE